MAEVNGSGAAHTNGTVPVLNGHSSYAAKHNLADHFIGGNKLENAAAGPVKDFVAAHDGHTVITNVRFFYGLESFAGGGPELDADIIFSCRSSLPTTVLQRSRRFDRYGNGLTRLLAMSGPFSLR